MAEGLTHKRLKKVALFFLKSCCTDLVANEVKFRNIRCIADAVGINLRRKEVRIIEVKATYADFKRDLKLFNDKTYFNHAHYCYIMCPPEVIKFKELPYGYGLIYVNDDNTYVVVKKPIKNKELKTRFDTTLKNTCRAVTNKIVYTHERVNEIIKPRYKVRRKNK